MTRRLFALERYEHGPGTAATHGAEALSSPTTTLVAAVHLPADETVLALVEADDEDAVRAAAARAGWRVDRLTPAQWVAGP